MSILLKIAQNSGKQTVELVKGKTVKVKQPDGHVSYELVNNETGFGPQRIHTKRVGKDLEIYLEDEDNQVDLIIENYYDKTEGNETVSLISGKAENGKYYAYVPASHDSADAIAALKDGMLASEVLGGREIIIGAWLPHWGYLAAGALGVAVIALAAGGGGGGSGGNGGNNTVANPDQDNNGIPDNIDKVLVDIGTISTDALRNGAVTPAEKDALEAKRKEIQKLIDALPEGPQKANAQKALDAVQIEVNDTEPEDDIPDNINAEITTAEILLSKLDANRNGLVSEEEAEALKNVKETAQHLINEMPTDNPERVAAKAKAQALLDALPDPVANDLIKEDLSSGSNGIPDPIDIAVDELKKLIKEVEKDGLTSPEEAKKIDDARAAIQKLVNAIPADNPDGKVTKDKSQALLDTVPATPPVNDAIDRVTNPLQPGNGIPDNIDEAIYKAVKQKEANEKDDLINPNEDAKLQKLIDAAQALIDVLPTTTPEMVAVKERAQKHLDEVTKKPINDEIDKETVDVEPGNGIRDDIDRAIKAAKDYEEKISSNDLITPDEKAELDRLRKVAQDLIDGLDPVKNKDELEKATAHLKEVPEVTINDGIDKATDPKNDGNDIRDEIDRAIKKAKDTQIRISDNDLITPNEYAELEADRKAAQDLINKLDPVKNKDEIEKAQANLNEVPEVTINDQRAEVPKADNSGNEYQDNQPNGNDIRDTIDEKIEELRALKDRIESNDLVTPNEEKEFNDKKAEVLKFINEELTKPNNAAEKTKATGLVNEITIPAVNDQVKEVDKADGTGKEYQNGQPDGNDIRDTIDEKIDAVKKKYDEINENGLITPEEQKELAKLRKDAEDEIAKLKDPKNAKEKADAEEVLKAIPVVAETDINDGIDKDTNPIETGNDIRDTIDQKIKAVKDKLAEIKKDELINPNEVKELQKLIDEANKEIAGLDPVKNKDEIEKANEELAKYPVPVDPANPEKPTSDEINDKIDETGAEAPGGNGVPDNIDRLIKNAQDAYNNRDENANDLISEEEADKAKAVRKLAEDAIKDLPEATEAQKEIKKKATELLEKVPVAEPNDVKSPNDTEGSDGVPDDINAAIDELNKAINRAKPDSLINTDEDKEITDLRDKAQKLIDKLTNADTKKTSQDLLDKSEKVTKNDEEHLYLLEDGTAVVNANEDPVPASGKQYNGIRDDIDHATAAFYNAVKAAKEAKEAAEEDGAILQDEVDKTNKIINVANQKALQKVAQDLIDGLPTSTEEERAAKQAAQDQLNARTVVEEVERTGIPVATVSFSEVDGNGSTGTISLPGDVYFKPGDVVTLTQSHTGYRNPKTYSFKFNGPGNWEPDGNAEADGMLITNGTVTFSASKTGSIAGGSQMSLSYDGGANKNAGATPVDNKTGKYTETPMPPAYAPPEVANIGNVTTENGVYTMKLNGALRYATGTQAVIEFTQPNGEKAKVTLTKKAPLGYNSSTGFASGKDNDSGWESDNEALIPSTPAQDQYSNSPKFSSAVVMDGTPISVTMVNPAEYGAAQGKVSPEYTTPNSKVLGNPTTEAGEDGSVSVSLSFTGKIGDNESADLSEKGDKVTLSYTDESEQAQSVVAERTADGWSVTATDATVDASSLLQDGKLVLAPNMVKDASNVTITVQEQAAGTAAKTSTVQAKNNAPVVDDGEGLPRSSEEMDRGITLFDLVSSEDDLFTNGADNTAATNRPASNNAQSEPFSYASTNDNNNPAINNDNTVIY